MRQFLVPQFIDVEDKIIGPITTRQFVMMLISLLLVFVFFKILAFIYFIVASVLTVTLFAALAFAKINGRPIHFFLLNFVQTIKRPDLRVWNRGAFVQVARFVESGVTEKVAVEYKKDPVSGSRLRDLTLVINTGGVYESED
jgi:hypothetical protein